MGVLVSIIQVLQITMPIKDKTLRPENILILSLLLLFSKRAVMEAEKENSHSIDLSFVFSVETGWFFLFRTVIRILKRRNKNIRLIMTI